MIKFFFVALVISLVKGSCHTYPPVFGTPNLYPIVEAASNMRLINETINGKLYVVEVPQDGGNTTSNFTVIHVWGSAYDMGFAQGALASSTINVFVDEVWEFVQGQIDQFLGDFPLWLQTLIADLGLETALDLTYEATVDYTLPQIYQELQGISDASGVDYNTLVRIHMIAGLTQGACSMFGMWGDAIDPSSKLLQLRALDWNMQGPFKNYPSITVYHPQDDGHPFMIVTMIGFIGALTGSSANLSVSEIGVGYPDSTFGDKSRIGKPFIFLLREILQYDLCLDDASNRMINNKRTCDLILGVGDVNLQQFRGYQYSSDVLNIMNPQNMRPDNDTWHPKFPDVVYWGMDWDCPSYNYVLSQQITKYYGTITPALAIEQLMPVERTGDNHVAIYDLSNNNVYVSFARQDWFGGLLNAYDRQFTQFNTSALFSEPAPVSNEDVSLKIISTFA